MIRIRKITNPYLGANARKVEAVKDILRNQSPGSNARAFFTGLHRA